MANNTVNTGRIEETKQSDLKSILRIMDVASELRRQRELAEGELNIETEKEKIREKIRQTAELTGEDLTEEEINVAIKNFYDGLYSCLLYTSPSPRDQRGSRMPSSA